MIPLLLALAGPLPGPSTDPPGSVLAAVIWLGGVIILGLLTALRTLWKVNQELRTKLDSLAEKTLEETEARLERSLTVTIDATKRIATSEQTMDEAMKAVEAATVMMHTLAGRQMNPEVLTEIALSLRELRDTRRR